MKILNDAQLENLKCYIDEKLRQRCFFVKTELKQVENKNGIVSLTFSSEKFNTVPVIHSEIELCDFGGGVKEASNEYIVKNNGKSEIKIIDQLSVWINIVASYKGNCEEVLHIKGVFNTNDSDFFPIN